jgi:hypothetical protein
MCALPHYYGEMLYFWIAKNCRCTILHGGFLSRPTSIITTVAIACGDGLMHVWSLAFLIPRLLDC